MEVPHHHVGGFDVAMDDALRVGVLESVEKAEEELDPYLDGILGEVVGIAGSELLDDAFEGLTLHVLHHEEVALLVDAGVVNRHDVRVLEAADGADLVDETGEDGRVGQLGEEALERDLAIDIVVADEDHFAHASRAKELRGFVAVS